MPGPKPLPKRPHFSFPFSRSADGTTISVVEEGSTEQIMTNVQMIARCPVGYRLDRPEFGWPWPDMTMIPVDSQPLLDAINRFEPRARAIDIGDPQALANAAMAVQDINVDVQIQSGDSTGVTQDFD